MYSRIICLKCLSAPIPRNGGNCIRFSNASESSVYTLRRCSISTKLSLPECEESNLLLLFQVLSIHSIVAVLEAVVNEFTVILYTSDYSILTPLSEALLSLLSPFIWE